MQEKVAYLRSIGMSLSQVGVVLQVSRCSSCPVMSYSQLVFRPLGLTLIDSHRPICSVCGAAAAAAAAAAVVGRPQQPGSQVPLPTGGAGRQCGHCRQLSRLLLSVASFKVRCILLVASLGAALVFPCCVSTSKPRRFSHGCCPASLVCPLQDHAAASVLADCALRGNAAVPDELLEVLGRPVRSQYCKHSASSV